MLLSLLNKNDKLKLLILTTLESNPHAVSVTELAEAVQVSEYHVTTTIDALMSDVDRLHLPMKLFTIDILENKVIAYTRQSSLSAFNYLLYIYSQESSFAPFFDNFLFEKATSQVEFLDANFLSKTSFFRLRKQFEDTLTLFNITMTSKIRLLGSERDIRGFLYIYLLTSCGDVKVPFTPSLAFDFDDLIDKLEAQLITTFSDAIRLKLRYYFYVIFVRTGLHHYYVDDHANSQTIDANITMPTIYDMLADYFDLSVTEASLTVSELFFFLFSNGIVSMLPNNNDPLPVITAIRETFSTHFQPSIETLGLIFTPEINIKLAQFLTHIKYFSYPINLLVDPAKISYLNDNFQDYQAFSESVITNLLPKYFPGREAFFTHHRDALITDLLLLIIANFNLTVLSPPVTITIDFTYGENYAKFIENEILNFSTLNLTVSHKITDKTDILISNLSPHVLPTVHKLQWTSPPTATDWAFLGDLIVAVKKERHLQHDSSK